MIALRKKGRISLSVEKDEVLYERPKEAFLDKVVIRKDTWGYEKIAVMSEGDFLIPQKSQIWTDQFVENAYELEYVIDPGCLRKGTNYGRIFLAASGETLEVRVTVREPEAERAERRARRQKGLMALELTQNYLNFRLGHIDVEMYEKDGMDTLEKGGEGLPPFWRDLLFAQLALAGTRRDEGKRLLDSLAEREGEIKEASELAFCGLRYLQALFLGSGEAIAKAVEAAREPYGQTGDWRYLWFLLHLDREYEDPRKRRDAILSELRAGCVSPAIYFELCSVYNQEPGLLEELSRENIRALHWGVRMHGISDGVALRYVLLAGKLAHFRPLAFQDLGTLYRRDEKDETLTEICRMLIWNGKGERRYFPWYQLGVERQLRLTNLYEYYMYALEEDAGARIPSGVLVYFLYDSALGERKKAFLYSYLVRRKEEMPELFASYEKRIRHFAIEQLEKGNNDENLSVLYEELLADGYLMASIADSLAKVMFQYQVVCRDGRMRGVCVAHKELSAEEYVPLERGRAIVSLATEGAMVAFVDGEGNRYAETTERSIRKLNHLERLMEDCYRIGSRDPLLILALCEKLEFHKEKEDGGEIQRQALALPGISPAFRKRLYKRLLEQDYDAMRNESLEALLADEGLCVEEEDESRVAELSMIYGEREAALRWVERSCWDRIPSNRIQRFLTLLLLQEGMDEERPLVTRLAAHVFRLGKCGQTILRYLARYYEGPAEEMFLLWRRCEESQKEGEPDFLSERERRRLEEEILCRALFCEGYTMKHYPVFSSYYHREPSGSEMATKERARIIRAFLSYNAYRYVVHDRIIHEEIFGILKRELSMEDSEIGRLALLKRYAEKRELSEEERQFCDIWVARYAKQDRIFPFFQQFRGKIPLPRKIADRVYVSYLANPKKQVSIRYAFVGEDALRFQAEPMRQAYPGVFVKGFLLFYDEELDYYICEGEDGAWAVTESDAIRMEDIPEDAAESSRSLLDFMLLALEVRDDKALQEGMEQYVKRRYVGERLFRPI